MSQTQPAQTLAQPVSRPFPFGRWIAGAFALSVVHLPLLVGVFVLLSAVAPLLNILVLPVATLPLIYLGTFVGMAWQAQGRSTAPKTPSIAAVISTLLAQILLMVTGYIVCVLLVSAFDPQLLDIGGHIA